MIEINKALLEDLHEQARGSERLRMNKDLRTSAADGSQRMLNALEPGTKVAVHRHRETSETVICLQGCMDVVIYEVQDTATIECSRVRLCPAEGKYGVQLPMGTWHSVEVYEPSTIFEAKDGAFVPTAMVDVR